MKFKFTQHGMLTFEPYAIQHTTSLNFIFFALTLFQFKG